MEDIKEFYLHEFDFDNQHKTTYDDWLEAFRLAIKKRAVPDCFIGLSSGYDSGAMSKELLKQGIPFKAYVMYNNENKEVLDKRLQYIPEFQIGEMNRELWQKYYDFLNGKINKKAQADKASMCVAYMFDVARNEGRKISHSRQAGDEINSDYALFPKQSTFKGKYPDKLYEWPNFRNNMQREYLSELEEIAALYDIEVRYPFIDINLVQEFLWLSPELN